MTDKQRSFIIFLNAMCAEKKLTIRAEDDDLLGKDWFVNYKNYTPEYTSEVIDKMKMALGMPITKKEGKKK